MLTLHANTGFTSPYAITAFVALKEKGLEFELRLLDLDAGEHLEAGYAKRSGTVRIPLLEHDDFRLTESSAIAEYLEEAYPPPEYPALYPTGLRERARSRQIQAWLRSDLSALRIDRSTDVVFPGKPCGPLTDAGHKAADKLLAFADALVESGDADLFGEWSIADTDLAVMLNRLVLNGDAVPAKLAAYATRQWERPSVRELRDYWQ